MEYTNSIEQLVFLRDADIAANLSGQTISGNTITENGIPSFDLFKNKYEEVSGNINTLSDKIEFMLSVDKQNVTYRPEVLTASTVALQTSGLTSFFKGVFEDDDYWFKHGWLYKVNDDITLSDETGKLDHFGKNDFVLFNKDVVVKDITFDDFDFIRDSVAETTALSNDIYKNFFILSANNNVSGDVIIDGNLSVLNTLSAKAIKFDTAIVRFNSIEKSGISDLTATSAEISILNAATATITDLSANKLSAELSDITIDSVGTTLLDLSTDLKNLISSNDNDISFLSHEISTEVIRNLNHAAYFGDVTLSSRYAYVDASNVDNTLYGLIRTNISVDADDRKLRTGFIFKTTGNIDLTYALSDKFNNVTYAHNNEYIIITKDVDKVIDVALSDMTFIRDYDLSVNLIQNQLTSNDNDINYLSSEISANDNDILFISSEISANDNDISYLSSEISANDNDISYLSNAVSSKIWIKDPTATEFANGKHSDLSIVNLTYAEYMSLAVEGKLDSRTLYTIEDTYNESFGQVISNAIMTVDKTESEVATLHYVDQISASLSNTVKLSVENIQSLININDTDISKLSANDKYLSSELSTLQDHYYSTFEERVLTTGDDISVDNLQLFDETAKTSGKYDKYYMTFKYGTMVLVKNGQTV